MVFGHLFSVVLWEFAPLPFASYGGGESGAFGVILFCDMLEIMRLMGLLQGLIRLASLSGPFQGL